MLILSAAALVAWIVVLLLPWRPYSTRERLEAGPISRADLSDITVLIPARNEQFLIGGTLRGLAAQGGGLRVVVLDDESSDETVSVARGLAGRFADRIDVRVVRGAPLPPGWGGKLWALQQAFESVERQYCLLLDADIELAPGLLPSMLAHARATDSALVSIMARLRCDTFWERLLVPPFVFFFKLLYPFGRVNDPSSRAAAAAGGCLLIETHVLREVGGFETIRGALIDDCSLAAQVKDRGHRIWLGLSHSVRSRRGYATFTSFSLMVTRTAFTQLHYSLLALLLVTAIMLVVFVAPVVGLLAGGAFVRTWLVAGTDVTGPHGMLWAGPVSVLALSAMLASYRPTVSFYGLSRVWLPTLPLAGVLFLFMTWRSALNYWRGYKARWKDRTYAAD